MSNYFKSLQGLKNRCFMIYTEKQRKTAIVGNVQQKQPSFALHVVSVSFVVSIIPLVNRPYIRLFPQSVAVQCVPDI